jgi:hypothetical protein
MDKLDDLIKQIEQLRAKQAALTGKPAALFDVNNIEQANAAIQSLEDSIETAQRKVDELEAGFGGIYDQLKAITEEYSKQVTGADRVNKAATGILGISQKLKYDQQGILDLSKKDLENNDKKLRSLRDQITEGANEIAVSKELVKLNDEEFESKLKYYKTTQLISEEEEAILRAQRAGFPVFENLIKQNEKRLELENKIQKSLGLTGDVTKLLGKIPGVGSAASEAFNDVEKEVKEIVKETGKVPDRFQTMGMFADKFGKILIEKITDPLAGMLMAFKAIKDTITAVDKGTVQLQKSLSLSYGEARELRKELSAAALANGNNLVNTQDLLKAQANLNNLLGVQGKINEDNLATQAELTKLLGISEQSAAQLQYFSEATGNDFEQQKLASYEITSEISSQYGVQVNQQKVMEEVGKQSALRVSSI